MAFKSVLLVVLVVFAHAAYAYDYHGDKYQKQSADDKTKELWTAVEANKTSNEWPSALELAELFVEDLNTTFDNVGDDMPKQFFDLQTRPKVIHSVGAVAKGTFTVKNSKYTGIFATGCQDVIIRFSLANEPDITGPGFTPAISLKFLRDTKPSGNIFGMYSLLGQDSWNFFKHDLTNHVPAPFAEAPLQFQLIALFFGKVSAWPVFLGLSDLARFDEHGKEYPKPVFPFRVIFHPTKALHDKFPDGYPGMNLQQQLQAGVPVGPIFDVYVQDDPTANATYLGDITVTTVPSASFWRQDDVFRAHPFRE